MKYVVSCGGTGGHMYPGLAVAAALAGRGHAVSVILSGRSVESEKPGNGLPPGVGAWRASIPRPQPRRPLACIRWAFSAIPLFFKFLRHRPDALLAMGSYTSIPPVLAARAALVPVVFHEANALPGKAVRALAPLARKICVAFPGMEPRFPRGCRVVKTGMPLRAGFSRGLGGSRADKTRFNLLVMGGSQGAQNLNKLVVEAFAAAAASDPAALERRHFRIVHLAGRTGESEVRALWSASGAAKCGVEVEVVPFESDMPRRYAEADACISRAGASSCFELALAGVPTIFVPLPKLARDHQSFNAAALAEAAKVVRQDSPDAAARLTACVFALADDPRLRAEMRQKALALSEGDAALRVAEQMEAL